ncbi:MAG: hypothetical protein BGN87_16535 [Rhizobiales bacterium 65-79]|jgi:hypothetical protein|nr:MAG: hypothetical protein BGN87_16535 [Rhizobiales bacterium 65-79]
MPGVIVHSQLLVTAALLLALSGTDAVAGATATAQAHVAIHIGPIATISFPKGTNFTIVVPDVDCRPDFDHDHRHSDFDRDPHHSDFDRDSRHSDSGHGEHRPDSDHGHHPDSDHDPHHSGSDHDQHHCDASWWPPIPPVRIPFVVKGNALASVSAIPDAFLRIKPGFYLGKAVSHHGEALGYQVMVRFPFPKGVSDWEPDWSGPGGWNVLGTWPGFQHLPFQRQVAELPGANGVGTPALSADLAQSGSSAVGIIYIVAKSDWTAWGDRAPPGFYHGSIEVTVSAAQ